MAATWKKVVIESTADTIAQGTTGNAATATALETARTIGGVSFDGTANIDLPGVNTSGNQDTSGNAATATALATGRDFSITGDVTASAISFDGTGNVALSSTISAGSIDESMLNATNAPTNDYILSYDQTSGGFTWISNTASANNATITVSAGTGLIGGGDFTTNQSSNETITLNVDLKEVQETAVAVGTDYVVFLDGGATGTTRKESIADLVTAMTGTNLVSQAGVIQLTANPDITGTLDVTGNATFDANVTIAGDLTVSGTTTTINTTNLEVEDHIILVATNSTPTPDTGTAAGLEIETSATAGHRPRFEWTKDEGASNDGTYDGSGTNTGLTGWKLSNHQATNQAYFPISVMEMVGNSASAPTGNSAGVGSFFFASSNIGTTDGELYIRTK